MNKAYIGLGGNTGDPAAAMRQALAMIEERGLGRVVKVSSFYRTEPVGVKDQPWFINAAAEVMPSVSPLEFRDGLQKIESDLGREPDREKDGPRPIDLDVLLWGDERICEDGLSVPHPRMHLRRFVLEPLAEIAPELVHPILEKSVADLLRSLDDPARVLPAGGRE